MVLLSASVDRFSVSSNQDFFSFFTYYPIVNQISVVYRCIMTQFSLISMIASSMSFMTGGNGHYQVTCNNPEKRCDLFYNLFWHLFRVAI